jgi:hypothetical protein
MVICQNFFIDGQALAPYMISANLMKTQEYGKVSLTQVLMELMDFSLSLKTVPH